MARVVKETGVVKEARGTRELAAFVRQAPADCVSLEGKFSLPYNMAAALADGEVTVATFTDEAVARLGQFRDKVHVHPTADLPANGARIRLQTNDGLTLEREPAGSSPPPPRPSPPSPTWRSRRQ